MISVNWVLRKARSLLSVITAVMIACGPAQYIYADENILVSMDFENYEEGAELKGSANWDVQMKTGDSCVIETDPVTGSKAIKFTKGGTVDNAYLEYSLPQKITSGIVKVSYDMRIASATKYFQIIGAVRNDVWSNYISPRLKGENLYNGDGDFIGNYKNMIGNDWCHCVQTVNITKGTLNYELYKDDMLIFSYYQDGLVKNDLRRLIFSAFEDRSWHCNGWEATYQPDGVTPNPTDPDGVLYVDNIVFEQIGFSAESSYPADKSENIDVDSDVYVEFNAEPADDISKYIEITRNGEVVSQGIDYSANDSKVYIEFADMLEYESDYTITVKSGAKAEDEGYSALSADYSFSFSTLSIAPEINGIEADKRYNAKATAIIIPVDGTTAEAELSFENGEFTKYISGTEITQIGKYILKVTASKNGKSQVIEMPFEIVGLVPPRAENVEIVKDGLTLTGKYIFIDDNGDNEADTSFKWYKKSLTDDDFVLVDGAVGKTYEITEEDVDSEIIFAVCPKSDNEPNSDTEYKSEPFLMPSKPQITSEVKLEGTTGIDSEIKVVYEYFDANGDEEEGTVFEWYRTDKDDKNERKIENADTDTYKMGEEDTDCYIFCRVTPKNNGDFGVGKTYESNHMLGLFSPVAENVQITGTVAQGRTVGASFKFSDKNNDKEGTAKYEWYVGSRLVSEDAGYKIPSDAEGTLTLKVTPYSESYPFEGEQVSVSKNISKSSGSGSSGGGSGGGNSGGGSGLGISISAGNGVGKIEITNNQDEEQKPNDDNKDETVLTDIKGHWGEEAINKLFEKGIVTGDEYNHFNPDNNITRAEVAAILVRAFNLEQEYTYLFTDVSGNEWYAGFIGAVSSCGIMNGDIGYFRPNDLITREELCVALANASEKFGKLTEEGTLEFEDTADISQWALNSCAKCYKYGLISGMGNNRFEPKQNATRAQTASIISRLIDIMEE